MSDQTLFDQEVQIDPNKDYTEVLVGEGKKFKTIQDLARSVMHKDVHIAKIEGENAQAREELNRRKNMEELVETLRKTDPATTNTNSDSGQPKTPDVNVNELIQTTLASELSKRERAGIEAANVAAARKALTDAFGENFAQRLSDKANELGMTTEELDGLARRSPKAFISLVGADKPDPSPQSLQPPRSVFNSSGVAPKPSNSPKNYSYWQKLRKDNPAEYKQRYMEMHETAQQIGEAFFS